MTNWCTGKQFAYIQVTRLGQFVSKRLMQWLQLRFDFDSTAVRLVIKSR